MVQSFNLTHIAILNKDFDPNENWSDNVEKISGVMTFALDAEAAEEIWNLREELTGISFDI